MQVVLHVSNGKANLKKVVLKSNTVIGRSPECNLKIASSLVSRKHCRISITDTQVCIRDFGSANGTFVDGKQVPAEQDVPLAPGSSVVVGPLKFVVQFDAPQVRFDAPLGAVPALQASPLAATAAPAAVQESASASQQPEVAVAIQPLTASSAATNDASSTPAPPR